MVALQFLLMCWAFRVLLCAKVVLRFLQAVYSWFFINSGFSLLYLHHKFIVSCCAFPKLQMFVLQCISILFVATLE